MIHMPLHLSKNGDGLEVRRPNQMVHPAADRQQMVALLQRLEGGIALKFIFAVFSSGSSWAG